jgi:hypothetical protein
MMAVLAKSDNKASVETKAAAPVKVEQVQDVAYRLFLERGGVHGHDQEDWLKAEQIVRKRRA